VITSMAAFRVSITQPDVADVADVAPSGPVSSQHAVPGLAVEHAALAGSQADS
jgi:hypothetical protein